jgi:hypothetical protein
MAGERQHGDLGEAIDPEDEERRRQAK